MTGTDVTMRAAPPRRFENYVLTRLVDSNAGLTQIPATSFTQVPGGVGTGATDDATSEVLPIGFDFQIDGITYKQWCVNCNGWMALVDPTTGTFTAAEVLNASVWVNAGIKPTFTSSAVLLAPWFDDLRNALSSPSQLTGSPFAWSATKVSRITQGLESVPIFVNSSSYGVSYYLDIKSPQGRRLIVRWASISNYTSPSSAIRFEVVIYENGTIEYRYTPRLTITASALAFEGATVGIFMPNGTNRFRDFSIGLGYRETSRREYVYGGYAYDSTYTDSVMTGNEDYPSSAAYTISLLPYYNWPGLAMAGCILTFSPPRARRKILPRRLSTVADSRVAYPLVARTGDSRLGTGLNTFDDRLSPNYTLNGSTGVVNYPTTLPRFFGGNGAGVLQRQDLFFGDFLVTGSVVKSAIDQYVVERPEGTTEAFNEAACPEQSGASDVFFMSGSDPSYVADGFNQPLRSKTHVKFSLLVDTAVTMPAASSSIYYYNLRTKAWEVPTNSTYVLGNTATVPPSPNPYAGGDWANPMTDAIAGRILEDARGFGPVGNMVSSGSHTPMGAGDQTDASIGAPYSFGMQSQALAKQYDKSVRNNSQYSPVANETFTIPINSPFLVEKAVFEVPLQAGPGWFRDMTQCFIPLSNRQSFDFGGPGLTIALWRRVQLGCGPTAPTRLDLILTGTITHVYDMTASVVMSNFPSSDSTYQVRPVGFPAYAGPPGGVVNDRGSQQFTGSVVVKAQALNTAGISLIYRRAFVSSSHTFNSLGVRQLMTQSPVLKLSSSADAAPTTVQMGYVSPFGRGGAGLQPAGRSILGNEFTTWQGMPDESGQTIANPFYLGSSNLTAQQSGALASSPFAATASAVIHVGSHFPAPYLVMPDDKLVLSISKTRPVIYGAGQWFSGSATHDVLLPAGRVNVTLYGSQVAAGVEYHDTLNQPLNTYAIHELLGAEPVLDQYEVSYRNELSGTFTDNMMLGTLSTQTVLSYSGGTPSAWVKAQMTRDRRLSRLNARNAPALTTSSADIAITPSKSFRTEAWWEMVGNVRTSQFIDSTERYWDSMMPSVKDCFAADGCGIFITPYGTFGNSLQIDTGASGSLLFTPQTTRMGWIWMDYGIPSLVAAGYGPLVNVNWNKAYPYEPRYQGASRQLNIERSLVATYLYGGTPTIQQISPTVVNGFAFGTTALETSVLNFGGVFPLPNSVCWDWIVDVNLSARNVFGYYVTGSSARDDMARALFGFGDRNTCYNYVDTERVMLGSNHVVETRDVEGPHPSSVSYDNNFFRVSPRIRGWKYGVHSGLPTYTKAYWRRGRFGQFRDMLEQRPYGKFYQTPDNRETAVNLQSTLMPGPVTVTFVDQVSNRLTAAENTWSSNLHFECTSSLPFFDGTATNRPLFDPNVVNLDIDVIKHDLNGNISLGASSRATNSRSRPTSTTRRS